MNRIVLLIIAICLAEIGYSQTDFRNGYIITNAKDTLVGLVDYREGSKGHKVCDFKKSTDQNTISYEPTSIIGYGFENDKFFQSKEISIKGKPSEVVFIEVIVRGLVSLYRFEDKFFIEKNDGGLQQLINEQKEVIIDGRLHVKKTNQYLGTINILLHDCEELRLKVQRVRLDEKELANLIESYNRCMGAPSFTFKAKKPWTKAMIGVTAGLNISQLDFTANPGYGYEYLTEDFEVSKSLMIGVSFDILSPRISERISFHSDILYLKSNYYGYSLIESSASTKRNYVTIELQQLKIPMGFRYTFPKRNFTPYFNLGVSSTFHLSSGSTWVQEVESNNIVQTFNSEALPIKNYQLGLWGGFGVLKSINQKLNGFIELRYERTDGISMNPIDPDAALHSKIANFQVLIGIRTK